MRLKALHTLLYPVLVLALAACSHADEPAPAPQPEQMKLSVRITVGDPPGTGRATPAGDYDRGEGYENYIHVAEPAPDVRVYLFDTDDKLVAEIASPEVTPVESTVISKTYLLLFKVDESVAVACKGKSLKVLMLANWRNYPATTAGVTTIDMLSEAAEAVASYPAPPSMISGPDERIPLFGVSQFDDISFDPYHTNLLGDIFLLRALGKIEIWDPNDTDNILSVTLHNYNSAALKMPAGVYHQDDYVRHEYESDYTDGPSLPDAPGHVAVPLPLRRNSEGHYLVYLPEYVNAGGIAAAEKMVFEVVYADHQSFTVHFKDYATGRDLNLMRNYWYKFRLNRLEFDIKPQVDVLPYGEIILNPDFGLDTDDGTPDHWQPDDNGE